jgi:hypothetical protein
MAMPCGTAKLREETSKKTDMAADRLAAMHKLGSANADRKVFFCSAA